MSGFLKSVDQRTQLAGMNRMELLLFRLNGDQLFGINVFKVREVIHTPDISPVPRADPKILGVSDIRGHTIPMIDLGLALGGDPVYGANESLTIVTEFNSSVQGFVVHSVQRIVHLRWVDIAPPPETLHHVAYLTGLTRVDNKIVEIVDVEKILVEVSGREVTVDLSEMGPIDVESHRKFHVLVADDSSVARKQVKMTLDKLGIQGSYVNNGREAWDLLQKYAQEAEAGKAPSVANRLLMLISDIEMPEMDGYTLTANVRKDPRMQGLYIILNSSLSGGFNESLTEKVGANKFFSKWHANELAEAILKRIEMIKEE